MGLELQINPFLRCTAPAVVEAARGQGADASDPVTVLAALREWKNRF
jgi:hydroxyacylglutathione hydrolase